MPRRHGYNTANSHQQGISTQPKTNDVHMPLIAMAPSDPDTMMIALAEAHLTCITSQESLFVFTYDLPYGISHNSNSSQIDLTCGCTYTWLE